DLAYQHLASAAGLPETLYGMLARDQLGLDSLRAGQELSFTSADWRRLEARPNVKIAIALTELGQIALADEVLRHELRRAQCLLLEQDVALQKNARL
ncbi:MAG: hypothetical protein AAGI13_14385, partial [Pseudomonadota bacterium]